MDAVTNGVLGVVFLFLGVANTYLMFHLWGYPFDKETRTSAAPKSLMLAHRVIGYLFVALYVFMMVRMVPRIWNYQVELPARTVFHLTFGFAIGFLLLIKVSIVRFFRHFEEWMPVLGTSLLLCTTLLTALSVPLAFRERALAASVPGGDAFSDKNLERVAKLLPTAGFPDHAPLAELATPASLRAGRRLLLTHCIKCHDLKTVLQKPRTPPSWLRTVTRMGEKPTLFSPISDEQQWQVSAYLVAITPNLKKSSERLRADETSMQDTKDAMQSARESGGVAGSAPTDPKAAEAAFEEVCSQCHESSDIERHPPVSAKEVDDLIERMIENDMEADAESIALIRWHISKRYVGTAPRKHEHDKKIQPEPAEPHEH